MNEFLKSLTFKQIAIAATVIFYVCVLILILIVLILSIAWGFG